MSDTPRDESTRRRERILIVCTQYIGDTLLAVPFLRNLRLAHPDAVIDICAEGGPRAVLANCPYVDGRVTWSRPPRERRGGFAAAFASLQAQADWLKSRGYTRAYLLKPSFSAAALATLDVLESVDGPTRMREMGQRLRDGIAAQSADFV